MPLRGHRGRMAETTNTAPSRRTKHDERGRTPARGFRRWPQWAPYAAVLWAFGYGLVALGWTYTGSGFPMGQDDPDAEMSLLGGMPAEVGAPLFAATALAAGALGLAMALAPRRRTVTWRGAAIGFGMVLAATSLFVVPDTRVLAIVGYVPMVAVLAPFDAGMRADLADAMTVQLANQSVAIVGGFLWAAATLAFARRTAGTCERCGRGKQQKTWTTPAAAASWGRWPVYVAAAIPASYAVTRGIWVAGFPMGIADDVHAEGMADGSLWSGAWLGAFALVGTTLTMGLVQRWGEVFPRWIPLLCGRRVPIGLAVVPASLVAAMVTSGGIGMYTSIFDSDSWLGLTLDNWAAAGPALLWPLWGFALAAGTLAYYLRRRGACGDCGLS